LIADGEHRPCDLVANDVRSMRDLAACAMQSVATFDADRLERTSTPSALGLGSGTSS
jgi:hypothetical protein